MRHGSGKRILGRLIAPTVILCWLAIPAAADGLSRFEQAIKEAPPGALTYKSAKALGDNGFVLEDVVLTPPPDKTPGAKTEPIPIKRVTVEDFDFASADKKEPPKYARIHVEGIVIGPKPAEGIDLAALAGIDKITADFRLDYRLDPDHKTMTLKQLALDLTGLARIELSMVLDGVTADSVEKPDAAMNDATLRTASFTFEDHSLLSKVLPAAAKRQKMEPAALVIMGRTMIDGMRDGQGPTALAVFDALDSYIEDYQHPKGPLRVTFNPPEKTSAASLTGIKSADDAIKVLGLAVSYAGTRPQKPAAPAAAK